MLTQLLQFENNDGNPLCFYDTFILIVRIDSSFATCLNMSRFF